MPEGEVRVTAADLPRLDGDGQYVAWVVNSETNQFQRVGAFNSAQSDGAVHYENVLPDAIPNNNWNLLLLTVEDDANADHPSADHSIAGVFPERRQRAAACPAAQHGRRSDEAMIATLVGDRLVGRRWAVAGGDASRLAAVSGTRGPHFAMGLAAGYGVRRLRAIRVR